MLNQETDQRKIESWWLPDSGLRALHGDQRNDRDDDSP